MERSLLTIGDAARHFGVPAWQVRRLFERGNLPPASRVAGYRVIEESDLPGVGDALRTAGYLKSPNGASVVVK